MRTIFIALLFFSFSVNAQEFEMPRNTEGKIQYTEIVQADSTNSTQLYSNARLYIANAFKSAKDVTQLNDESAKTLVVKGLIPVTIHSLGMPFEMHSRVKITIQCKDGRYKYSFDDFELLYTYNRGTTETPFEEEGKLKIGKKQWREVKSQTAESVKAMIADLKKNMVATAKSDW